MRLDSIEISGKSYGLSLLKNMLTLKYLHKHVGGGASENILEKFAWALPSHEGQTGTSGHSLFSIPGVTILTRVNFITFQSV